MAASKVTAVLSQVIVNVTYLSIPCIVHLCSLWCRYMEGRKEGGEEGREGGRKEGRRNKEKEGSKERKKGKEGRREKRRREGKEKEEMKGDRKGLFAYLRKHEG